MAELYYSSQLHWGGDEVRPDHRSERDLHDGPHLCLSLGLHQPPEHLQHQARRDLAIIQPLLPLPSHSGQCCHSGNRRCRARDWCQTIFELFYYETIKLLKALEYQQREDIGRQHLNDKIIQVESLMMMKPNEENEEQNKPLMSQSGQKTQQELSKSNYKILAFEIWAKLLNPIIYLAFTTTYFIYYCLM